MKPHRFFFNASTTRGLLESLAVEFILILLKDIFIPDTGSDLITFLIAAVLIGSYAGFRILSFSGGNKSAALEEVKTAILLSAGFSLAAVLAYAILSRLGISSPSYPDVLLDFVVLGCGGVVYFCWRIILWLWDKWDRMRRTKFVWSVMQVFALTILGIVMVAFLIIAAFIFMPGGVYQQTEPVSLTSQILQGVFQLLIWMMIAVPIVMVPLLIMLLPPMGLASFWMTRRLSSRLNQLEEAADRLSQGDLSARSPLEGEDEIAHLQEDFNRMADQLEKSNQALIDERDRVSGLLNEQRRLTASVSHELRTPLSIALAAIENSLAEPEDLSVENSRKNLETAQHEILHLQALIEDLFAVSKAELNHLNLRMTATDLAPIIRNAVGSMQAVAWKSGRVLVSADIPGPIPLVDADATRVEQVLINLLNNGVRHTPPGGFVMVTVETEPEIVRVSVVDSGSGIPVEELQHVWEPFYVVDETNTGDHTGLGLAIVKELITSMGGEVSGASEPTQGSTFSFSLKVHH